MSNTSNTPLTRDHFEELLLQSLTHEKGGILVYQAAIDCARRPDLREEWTKYLTQTEGHVRKLTALCEAVGVDPDRKTAGCEIVESIGMALVAAMKRAATDSDPSAAQLVACECVVLAETKDHFDWELLSACAPHLDGEARGMFERTCKEVEDEEDEHVYHSRGWARELWLGSLGLRAELPPAEEKRDIHDGVKAAKVQSARMHGQHG